MRLIGHLRDESQARTFGDYLYVQGMQNELQHDRDDGWEIWISDEDKLAEAAQHLKEFQANPADPKYRAKATAAPQLREAEEKEQEKWRQRLRNRRQLFRPLTGYGFGPLTFILIAISVLVTLYSNFGQGQLATKWLSITDVSSGYWTPGYLAEILHGQVWRLITPIFIHFDIAHLLFDMMFLQSIGSMIEGRQSSWVLLFLVILTAVGSNLAEVYIGRVPNFGGMSGVDYGLAGYVWMRGKRDPASGLFLEPTTMTMLIIWFFVCLFGLVGPIANAAHAGGFVIGVAWGYLSSWRKLR